MEEDDNRHQKKRGCCRNLMNNLWIRYKLFGVESELPDPEDKEYLDLYNADPSETEIAVISTKTCNPLM